MIKNKILYWPGRGQDLHILKEFRDTLTKQGYILDNINIMYDAGELKPNSWEQVKNNTSDWWIGISLGASLLYYSIQFMKNNKPNRITLINPFCSREILSKEKKFSLNNQWNFTPINKKVRINYLDMILSVNDEKIPLYHGIKILNNTVCENKQIIFVDETHVISDKYAQSEMAEILNKEKLFNRGDENERHNYCHIYKHT